LFGHADRTIRTYDNQTNTPGITCRVWVFFGARALEKENKWTHNS
jgi:hypothetical protein